MGFSMQKSDSFLNGQSSELRIYWLCPLSNPTFGWGCRIPAASLQRSWIPQTSVLDMIPGALGNAEYPFIVIAPMSTLTRSSSTLYGPIYGSNSPV